MTKITKKEITDAIADELKIKKSEAKDIFNAVTKVLKDKLQEKDVAVTLDGIGTFKTFVKPAFEMKSALLGGETIQVPEKQKVKFKASTGLYA
ncbi:HU family DNA-binding protein [Enterococcus cecorum]|uniref:HU family DNA-binding protein n=1 Tax=Enterococcus cecorum TaxID=44008 RepID=UPI00148B3D6E|nr:HU family DNA-binding protein [Enterococcus cecorum]